MKSHIQVIPTDKMTRHEWLRYRLSGIGASEVGTLMGLNPYKSSIQLFYEKVGNEIDDLENLAMFLGSESEDFIAKLWQHWPKENGTTGAMMVNYRAGIVVRECEPVKAFLRNPKYPWLFVTLDRKIKPYDNRDEGTLELKRLGGYEADKWEGGIVPSHVVQVQTQCLVPEFEYGELAVLQDGPDFSVYPFEYNDTICKQVIAVTKDFWDRVVRARQITTRLFHYQQNFKIRELQEAQAELQKLEPEPDGTQAYADFLKKKYKIDNTVGEKKGTDAQLIAARKHRECMDKIEALKSEALKYENTLKRDMGSQTTVLNFGDNGLVSWKSNVNNVRVFLNKIKREV